MGLQKKILCKGPTKKPTEEQQKRYDLAWEILCKTGSVNVTNPLKPVENIKDILRQDPYAFTGPFCDYHGDIPISEFIRQIKEEDNEN